MTVVEVVDDDEVLQLYASEHAHAATAVAVARLLSVCCQADDVAVADRKTVPLYVAVFLIGGVGIGGTGQTRAVALCRIRAVAGG